ncbi:MAG TPA: hypothetical protein VFV80_03385 [Geminicoccaceae bacterium]|nr:hypothetical protein [Geminicoccaceae bacterium]
MRLRHALSWLALAPALIGFGPPVGAAGPADPCALLFVPEGYELRCSVYRDDDGWRVAVRPENSLFSPLSELSVEPVEEPIEDPEAWLRGQLQIDLSGLEHVVRELARSEDSPFAGEEIGSSLETWLGMMHTLTEWPLQSCEEPSTEADAASGETSELSCAWAFGPFRQHLVIRLVERDGERYAVRIRAMNERRLRHLVAIANSL